MNSKIHYKLLCFALVVISLSSCFKKAITDFTIDKNKYSAGDPVIIENKTKNVATFRWTLKQPSGAIIKYSEVNPKIKLSPCAPDGDYSLTLQGAPQKGKATSTTKNFTVKTIKSYLYIYSSVNITDTINIKADGQNIGKLYNGNNILQIQIAAGLRTLTAGNGAKLSISLEEDEFYPWNVSE